MLRLLMFILVFGIALFTAAHVAEVWSSSNKAALEQEAPYQLKRIVEKVGPSLFKALVVDRQGHEKNLFISRDDVVEVKRGLWVIRPGNYKTDI